MLSLIPFHTTPILVSYHKPNKQTQWPLFYVIRYIMKGVQEIGYYVVASDNANGFRPDWSQRWATSRPTVASFVSSSFSCKKITEEEVTLSLPRGFGKECPICKQQRYIAKAILSFLWFEELTEGLSFIHYWMKAFFKGQNFLRCWALWRTFYYLTWNVLKLVNWENIIL